MFAGRVSRPERQDTEKSRAWRPALHDTMIGE